ncbi:hypothetical protein KAR91_46840 [Candidatus Pacearchaeota archaeon]|nr:hypothetical protein [Candidatus Pacearchaeota archaeon]
MTKENRMKLSKHFKKLGVDDPYGKEKKEKKILDPLPPIPNLDPDKKETEEDDKDA